jgi:hypothetical protein
MNYFLKERTSLAVTDLRDAAALCSVLESEGQSVIRSGLHAPFAYSHAFNHLEYKVFHNQSDKNHHE